MKYFLLKCFAFLVLVPLGGYAAVHEHHASVGKLSVVANSPFQFHIDLNEQVSPQAQMIAGPDRLVIDLPGSMPGPALRRLVVNQGAVKVVRTSLYSTTPPVTRVVVDLIAPQWYRIAPDGSGVLVTVGGSTTTAAEGVATVGWVSTKSAVIPRLRVATTASVPRSVAATPPPSFVNGAYVEFSNGLLTIRANNATLSEVLFQIQKKTGAEIAIPSGAEQEHVAADFGPAKPNEVLGDLLNGSNLNFVVVGSESDPNILRSVILTHMGPETNTMGLAQPSTPPLADNAQPEFDPTTTPETQQQLAPPPPQAPPAENPTPENSPPM